MSGLILKRVSTTEDEVAVAQRVRARLLGSKLEIVCLQRR